ncbi:RrF2 family transcriptional regulator [Stratiformator vulcanicus]|uniref:HTH-type transcriptional repressor NsrR n=1 Tax=Stratiformator vulcanicus TaxID=2527980 RepID=A0A517QYE2_9PLAN|nr:Rrf2 family transcriptional regulator [Stratiformator vulcanicus]QDT36676.1 HTH-type transcriptional repressor NsrR [Stratiformator vulcanicus]
MISQTVEYALRSVVLLAQRSPALLRTDEVAEVTQVPRAYLTKVLQALSKAGIIKTTRGAGGGVCLNCDPAELTILEVVNAVDPIERIRTCPLQLKAHGANLCPLHHRLDAALEQVESAFARTTLAEVLAEPTRSVPLCDFPTNSRNEP